MVKLAGRLMEIKRTLVSSSGTHSVRSDRVAPDSLRIFRGLSLQSPDVHELQVYRDTLYSRRGFQTFGSLIGGAPWCEVLLIGVAPWW